MADEEGFMEIGVLMDTFGFWSTMDMEESDMLVERDMLGIDMLGRTGSDDTP